MEVRNLEAKVGRFSQAVSSSVESMVAGRCLVLGCAVWNSGLAPAEPPECEFNPRWMDGKELGREIP